MGPLHSLLKVLVLLLLSMSTAFADPNLTVNFVNADPPSSNQCTSSASPTSSAFHVVITNIDPYDPTVTIKDVTFNGHDGAEGTTGTDIITGNSDSSVEQKYLLESCNGKQLTYKQSCIIPMIFNYGATAITTSTTLTVGAETDVGSGNYSTASFTVGNGMQQDQGLTIAFYNVADSGYMGYLSDNFDAGAFMPSGSSERLEFNGGGRSMPTGAIFNYTITNHSNITKTVGTRCTYSTAHPAQAGAVANSGTCDGVQLAPGKSCTASLMIAPTSAGAECSSIGQEKTGCYSQVANMLNVFDASSTLAVIAPENINYENLSFGWTQV